MYTGMRIATGSIKNILTYLLTYSTTVSNLALIYGTVVIQFPCGAHLSILNVNIKHHGAAHGRG